MPRNCHYALVIVFSLLIAAAAPQPRAAGGNQSSPAAAAKDGLSRVALAIDDLPKAPASDPGCDKAGENRQSDLCAQWKAADAAESSASWAAFAGWFGGLSFVGVLAAILVALRSNAIARDTAKRQLRAYVALDSVKPLKVRDESLEFVWKVQAEWKNAGQTPALNLCGCLRWRDFEGELPEDFRFEVPLEEITTGALPVGPQLSAHTVIPDMIPNWVMQASELVMRRTYVWGFVEYDDIFRIHHRTECAFEIVIDPLHEGVGVSFAPLTLHNSMT